VKLTVVDSPEESAPIEYGFEVVVERPPEKDKVRDALEAAPPEAETVTFTVVESPSTIAGIEPRLTTKLPAKTLNEKRTKNKNKKNFLI
jgi:hypothetical protein